jgi:hypothetical protein
MITDHPRNPFTVLIIISMRVGSWPSLGQGKWDGCSEPHMLKYFIHNVTVSAEEVKM